MAIVEWPKDVALDSLVHCVICSREVKLIEATAGHRYASGAQAFACNLHFWSGAQLMRGWTDFLVAQDRQTDLLILGEIEEKVG